MSGMELVAVAAGEQASAVFDAQEIAGLNIVQLGTILFTLTTLWMARLGKDQAQTFKDTMEASPGKPGSQEKIPADQEQYQLDSNEQKQDTGEIQTTIETNQSSIENLGSQGPSNTFSAANAIQTIAALSEQLTRRGA